MGCLLASCGGSALHGQAAGAVQSEPKPIESKTATIAVNARLVTIPVTVRDKKGVLITRLKQEDFALSEDGKPQTIRYFDREDDVPLTLGLLVDVSRSQSNALDQEREASSAFLDGMLVAERDKAFVVQFGSKVDLLADVTGSLGKLQAGLKKLDVEHPKFDSGDSGDPSDSQGSGSGDGRHGGRGRGGTALYDAIFLSSDEVIAKQQNRKALILLTDGVDSGSRESISGAIESAQRADTAVYAIYFKGEEGQNDHGGSGFPGGGRRGGGFPGGGGGGFPGGGGRRSPQQQSRPDGKKILERITGETGGRMFEVTKKETLPQIYRQIAEELRSQYRIGFTPSDASDGYHKVVVDLPKDKNSYIQAREGFYSGSVTQ